MFGYLALFNLAIIKLHGKLYNYHFHFMLNIMALIK